MTPMFLSAVSGALAMYFLDPYAGRRRRLQARDRLSEAQRMLKGKAVADDVLHERVRAALGRAVSHPQAIDVLVREGRVTLSGPIVADDVPPLFRTVQRVAGVRAVEDRLAIYEEAGNVSALQGGRGRRARFELLQPRWSPRTRLVTGSLGLLMFLRGGVLGKLGGAALFARAASNMQLKTFVGIGEPSDGTLVQKTISINAPPSQVFAFWHDYSEFPRFGRDPGKAEWASEVVNAVHGSLVEWRATAGSAIRQEGSVRFQDNGAGGTQLSVELSYLPPAGALGHAFGKLLGRDPRSEMDADLVRMKSAIEASRGIATLTST